MLIHKTTTIINLSNGLLRHIEPANYTKQSILTSQSVRYTWQSTVQPNIAFPRRDPLGVSLTPPYLLLTCRHFGTARSALRQRGILSTADHLLNMVVRDATMCGRGPTKSHSPCQGLNFCIFYIKYSILCQFF